MGKLQLVSTGAGGSRYLTNEAIIAIKEADLIVGYTKYIKDLEKYIVGKEIYTSGMTKEIDRATYAVESAKVGKNVVLISNGDANVYAMGSLVVELLDVKDYWNDIEYISLAGVTSILALASEVGAPLSQDFCLISLSDRLTNFDLIQKRIELSLECDFVIAIYNPKSRSRLEPYRGMLEKLSKISPKRVVIVARDLGRERQFIEIITAKELISAGVENNKVNMSTTILIGNSTTKVISNGKVLTPRGYLDKYDLAGEMKSEWRDEH
ncbi:MAG: precorrin-3B C(17)-methyltransferase [Sulfurovum sp.]|nr:precorrin-3B C(17)-methyltransferase [Sulfurovaceae bacterium]